jgi:hypothetical protein
MNNYYSSITNDVTFWTKHFKDMIDGDIIPDEHYGIFLINQTPIKSEKINTQAHNIEKGKDSELSLNIVSPVASQIDTAKSDLKEENKNQSGAVIDPITHFPQVISETGSSSLKRKRVSRKNSKPGVSKKRKSSAWLQY